MPVPYFPAGSGRAKVISVKPVMPRLFYAYAHGCGDVLVKRGTIAQAELDSVRGKLKRAGPVVAGPHIFEKAILRVKRSARAQKRAVTPAFIREYFLARHNPVVVRQAKIKRDVKPRRCWITPARIVSVRGKTARAKTPFGPANINIEFAPNLEVGNMISTHYGFACEKITKREFVRLWRQLE